MTSIKSRPSLDDGHPTLTSYEQHDTEAALYRLLQHSSIATPAAALPLTRNAHLNFLARALFQGFPKPYTSQDASQPWFIFWLLQAFAVLGAGLDAGNKQRAIDTILASQHPDGGFGGGPHQAPHLLPTYASVCALANVGRPGPGGGWDRINRKGMLAFFLSLKQPDGSFRVAKHAEVDIRGTYCLLATATLLNMLTPTLMHGIPAFVASCQTYEGGFAGASQGRLISRRIPALSLRLQLPHRRPPLGEAHGGYTSCALCSWALLRPLEREGTNTNGEEVKINVKEALRWLAKMQGGPNDIGGFRGRTNKLVDGCYSWWVGGCFALFTGGEFVDAVPNHEVETPDRDLPPQLKRDDVGGEWDDVEGGFGLRACLQEYILTAAQAPAGGLRDNPGKHSDAYHTLYNLAGLSPAQHRVRPSAARRAMLERTWISQTGDPEQRDERRKRVYVAAQAWVEDERKGVSRVLGGKKNRVNATHPLFNLTLTHSRAMLGHFYGQGESESES
ncbi:terpenoid cyclases/Protein prenyltransferase [Ramaria rubella]|nr:terpenoid cyclases/Protein prenyltransferase [Ramaria rubella]